MQQNLFGSLFRSASCAVLASLILAAGCHRQAQPAVLERQQEARAFTRSEATARVTLEEIPPPSKHLYLDVRSADAWQNPFLTVRRDSVTLRVTFPQQTSSALDAGTLLHPAAARRQDLEIRMKDIPEALSAVPDYAWPYGRVVAIQEAPSASREDRAQIRRNVEQTIRIVNDLDTVVNEWSSQAGTGLLH